LPRKQQKILTNSYSNGSWADVFLRNDINNALEELDERYGYNLLDLKCKVLKGKSVYLPRIFWELANEQLRDFKEEHIQFIFGGIEAIKCEQNRDVVLLVPSVKNNK